MEEVSYKPLIEDMTWSYSRVTSFESCPYKWYLRYIRFPKAKGKPTFFAEYGSFVHKLLEQFNKGELTAEEITELYLTGFRENVHGKAPNEKVFKGYFADGLRYLRTLEPSENKILSVEEEVHFTVGDKNAVGFIDLIEEDKDGSIILTDNKSRALKPRSTRAKPTQSDIELDEYLRQLYLYSAAVSRVRGFFPKVLCFNCFRKNARIKQEFDYAAYEATLEWFLSTISKIENETEFRPNVEWFKCNYLCEMQDYCEYYKLARG